MKWGHRQRREASGPRGSTGGPQPRRRRDGCTLKNEPEKEVRCDSRIRLHGKKLVKILTNIFINIKII